jgi:hypothetical protein
VQVLPRAEEFELVVGDAAESVSDRGDAGRELAAVADDDAIASQSLAVFGNERLQVGAADFFFGSTTAVPAPPGSSAAASCESIVLHPITVADPCLTFPSCGVSRCAPLYWTASPRPTVCRLPRRNALIFPR